MKKLSITFVCLLITVLSFSQGFETQKLRAGAGLFYASDINNIGLNINAAYEINDLWEAAVGYSYFFEKDYLTWSVLDLDAHYNFYTDGSKMTAYGLAGLAINFAKVTIPEINMGGGVVIPETTSKDSSVGLNLGVGVNYGLTDQLNLAPEFRVVLADGSYVRIGAMIQYLF